MTPKTALRYGWLKDWRTILAFCGITGIGGIWTTGQKIVGFLVAPAIHQADSTGRQAMRAMLQEFADTLTTQNRRNKGEILQSIDDIKDVVSRMPGAKAAREQIRRDSVRRARVFGWAEIRSAE